MNAYATYLVNRLKDEYHASHIVIKNMLIDQHGQTIWCMNNSPHYKKCSIVGIDIGCNFCYYYISNTTLVRGDAIRFSNIWNSYETKIYSVNDPIVTDSKMLESVFMQIMAITERKSVWLHGKKLFEKGHACEHLIQADLIQAE